MSIFEHAIAGFGHFFGTKSKPSLLSVPGRVNLVGEHIDYHNLPVLPIAIQKQIVIAFLPRPDRRIRAISQEAPGVVDFEMTSEFTSTAPGHWSNYVRAAAHAIQLQYGVTNGLDAYLASDLPSAAGLSSSSALLIACSLALLHVSEIETTLNELTALLPNSEQLVGTRGGAMDHVAILASRAGAATKIDSFAPLQIDYMPIPGNWRFLVAHSLVIAEKSGALRSEFNLRRHAGEQALKRLGFASYRETSTKRRDDCVARLTDESERNAYLHVTTEASRVQDAAAALNSADLNRFGRLLCESHASLRDRLRVSLPEIDTLVDSALHAGAYGARLTGAGFGGCVLCLCTQDNVESVRDHLVKTHYAHHQDFNPSKHLFVAVPSSGALDPQSLNNSNQHRTAND